MKRSSSGVSRLSSRNRRARGGERRVEVGDARVELRCRLPLYWLAEPLMTPWSALRVSGSKVLKIWSRSTAVVVSSPADDAAVGDLRAALRRHAEVDVAVGDAGEGGLADGRERAAAQRRVVVVDLHRDLRLAVGREVDVRDLADGRAAGLDEVALDELRGVLEVGLDRVAAARSAQQEHRGDDGHDNNGGHGRRSNDEIPREPHSSDSPKPWNETATAELAVIRDRGHTGGPRVYREREIPASRGSLTSSDAPNTSSMCGSARGAGVRGAVLRRAAALAHELARAGARHAPLDLHLAAAQLARVLRGRRRRTGSSAHRRTRRSERPGGAWTCVIPWRVRSGNATPCPRSYVRSVRSSV